MGNRVKLIPDDVGVYIFYCPGCKCNHYVHTQYKNHSGAQWTFDGNMERPTFGPSINISYAKGAKEEHPNMPDYRCHSFVQNGVIKFLNDCTHELKGCSVDLPEIK